MARPVGVTRKTGGPVIAPELLSRVLDQLSAALSSAVQQRVGGMGADPLVVLEVRGDETTFYAGDRTKMLATLVKTGVVVPGAMHFLKRCAPAGFVWVVVDWGDEVSTLLHTLDAPDSEGVMSRLPPRDWMQSPGIVRENGSIPLVGAIDAAATQAQPEDAHVGLRGCPAMPPGHDLVADSVEMTPAVDPMVAAIPAELLNERTYAREGRPWTLQGTMELRASLSVHARETTQVEADVAIVAPGSTSQDGGGLSQLRRSGPPFFGPVRLLRDGGHLPSTRPSFRGIPVLPLRSCARHLGPVSAGSPRGGVLPFRPRALTGHVGARIFQRGAVARRQTPLPRVDEELLGAVSAAGGTLADADHAMVRVHGAAPLRPQGGALQVPWLRPGFHHPNRGPTPVCPEARVPGWELRHSSPAPRRLSAAATHDLEVTT